MLRFVTDSSIFSHTMSLLSGLLPPEFIIDEQRLVGGNGDVSRRFREGFSFASLSQRLLL